MFRFIHAADLHLDSPLRGLESHENAPVDVLRGATRRALENLVQLSIDEQADFLVIAGDVYDGDWRDYNAGLFFRRQMARLRDKEIPVYLIAGNHDAASVISKKLSLPNNVHVFSTRAAESMEVHGLPVVIHGRGFPHRAVLDNLVDDYPAAVSGKFNLGLLHTSLNGRSGHDTYAPCSEKDLRDKSYGCWALGHIHQPEIVSEDPWIVFAGNCQGRQFGETPEQANRARMKLTKKRKPGVARQIRPFSLLYFASIKNEAKHLKVSPEHQLGILAPVLPLTESYVHPPKFSIRSQVHTITAVRTGRNRAVLDNFVNVTLAALAAPVAQPRRFIPEGFEAQHVQKPFGLVRFLFFDGFAF